MPAAWYLIVRDFFINLKHVEIPCESIMMLTPNQGQYDPAMK